MRPEKRGGAVKTLLGIAAFMAVVSFGCSSDGIYEPEPSDAGTEVCVSSDDKDGPACEDAGP